MEAEEVNPDDLSTEQLRAQAFASASYSIHQLAENSQKEALEYLTQHIAQLDDFISKLDTQQESIARTLVVGIAVTLLCSHSLPQYEEARHSFGESRDLLQKLELCNYEILPKSCFDILATFFSDGTSIFPQVYRDFTPENVEEKLGEVGLKLYDWLDGTFSLLKNRFEL
eukprot:Phypoly_transcript_23888.p1 GENE.Phypoly_transcript_23888~~Phypoly_transcript_23888.p1  ORF type:complete len:188 (+),score=32.96 Phypoly_transcript_23888:55-564(+)